MSDYDAMGMAPTNVDGKIDGEARETLCKWQTPIGSSRQNKHHEDSSIRMVNTYDETDDACRCEWRSEQPSDACHNETVWTTNNATKGEMYHVIIRDEIKPEEELKVETTIEEEPTQTRVVQKNPDNQVQQFNHVKNIHDDVETREIWNHIGQAYCVKEWKTNNDAQLACFTKGQKAKVAIGPRAEDDEDHEERENLVCHMTGEQWESLPFPIIIDSGACTSVMPTSWCPHVPTEETNESKANEFFRAANGEKIYNEGKKVVSLMTREGVQRDMKFTACEVAKALGSVSQICRAGHRVAFNPPWHEEGSYIEQVEIGEVMWMKELNGLYVLGTKIAPVNKQTIVKNNMGFGRPANP